MSFIYAHKISGKVRVLSDTKIYVGPNYKQQLEHKLKMPEVHNIIKFGMIKTVIYKNNIAISSAGHIEVFNELLKELYENNLDNIDNILDIALTIHNEHNNNTDFIITTDNDIYSIKNNKIEKSETAWIGDSDAFNKFQELKLTTPQKTITVITEDENYEENDEYSRVDDSFKYIVNERLFETVGGIPIICFYANDKFQYEECYSVSTGYNFKQVLKHGEPIVFQHNVEDGGFSYYAFNLDNNYAMDIDQSDKYLVYMPGYSNEIYKYLSLPIFINKN